jgi:hypothetical protein
MELIMTSNQKPQGVPLSSSSISGAPQFNIDLDVVRQCMLSSDIAFDLDSLVMAPPMNRCMIVAKALHVAAQSSPKLHALISESAILESLKKEAISRKSGLGNYGLLMPTQPATEMKERAHA